MSKQEGWINSGRLWLCLIGRVPRPDHFLGSSYGQHVTLAKLADKRVVVWVWLESPREKWAWWSAGVAIQCPYLPQPQSTSSQSQGMPMRNSFTLRSDTLGEGQPDSWDSSFQWTMVFETRVPVIYMVCRDTKETPDSSSALFTTPLHTSWAHDGRWNF